VNFDLVAKNNNAKPAIEIINTNMTFVAIDIQNEKRKYIDPFLFEQEEFEIYMKQKAYSKISADENIFHNQNHIEDMLTQLNMYKASISSNDYKRLFAAICYHDIEHKELCNSNRESCFNTFKRDWGKIISQEDLNAVYEYIKATDYDITLEDLGDNKNAHLIHDLNMISFIDYETMKNSDIKIKTEYSDIQPKAFYEIRLSYFKHLLNTNIFLSSKYKRYNSIASTNIKDYILEMEELLKEFDEE
jgi:predicted metal-dependent HD superfamily phosphohydrolase